MRKFWIILLCSLSIVISGQNWKMDSNPYNNPNRNPYDKATSKAEREITNDMNNIKKIISSSTKIYEHFKDDNNEVSVDEENSDFGPGAPGEPVPIDKNLILLIITAIIIICIYSKKRILE